MAALLSQLILFLYTCSTPGWASTGEGGHWNNPPPQGDDVSYDTNPVYPIGKTISMDWTTTYTNYSIALWQNIPGPQGGPITIPESLILFGKSREPCEFFTPDIVLSFRLMPCTQ
jgi:hypothetical protein